MAEEAAAALPSAPSLSATYRNPANASFVVAEPIPSAASSPGGTEAKTLHLSALRKAVSAVQDKVNKELTLRMEQDKAENTAAQARQAAVDEAAEEENYGEEVQGEDD